MNLDELQSVQARERQSSDLQHLRSSFYREVGEFISGLNEERARVVEAADDPFSEPEVRRLSDDIETAESTVEAIYERRVGKVVKKASIAAAGMPVDDDGLTSEEEALFDDLVARIESNRERVLSVLDGDAPTVSCSIDEQSSPADTDPAQTDTDSTPMDAAETPPGGERRSMTADRPSEPASAADGVSAADLMGSGPESVADTPSAASDATSSPPQPPEPEPPTQNAAPTDSADSSGTGRVPSQATETSEEGLEGSTPTPGRAAENGSDERSESVPGLPRTTVRITADIGEIVGADDRDYDLGTEDVVTLPEPNADVLIKKNAAERIQ